LFYSTEEEEQMNAKWVKKWQNPAMEYAHSDKDHAEFERKMMKRMMRMKRMR